MAGSVAPARSVGSISEEIYSQQAVYLSYTLRAVIRRLNARTANACIRSEAEGINLVEVRFSFRQKQQRLPLGAFV